jgi:release factor glutamine methyltransferase
MVETDHAAIGAGTGIAVVCLSKGGGMRAAVTTFARVSPAGYLDEAIQLLTTAGVRSAHSDAATLAAHVLGDAPTAQAPEAFQVDEFMTLVRRRCERVPLEHLTGRVRFRSLDLHVGPGVFVPQPETSSVVQWAVDAVRRLIAAGSPHPVCVDLCTGSGTMALALAAEVPAAQVHAVEVDPGALAWAKRNAEHHGLDVALHADDVGAALPGWVGRFDVVMSNPPYVATGELAGVRPEVRDHDPAIALDAGRDGLDIIRSIEATARRLLRPGGLVVVEHSDRQGRSAPAVFTASAAWKDVVDHVDHEGLDRFVTATKAA